MSDLPNTISNRVKIIVQNHAEKPSVGFRKLCQQKADSYVTAYLFASREMGLEWVHKKIISDQKKIIEVMEGSSSFKIMIKEKALAETKAQGEPVFLWVGRLNGNKDPLTVVKAFLQFAKQQPLARLYMVYQTHELLQEIKNLITTESKEHIIKLVGKLPHHQLEAWYNSADFIISGSHYEGSGIAVCEAMSCGCIPVLTDIPSFRKMTGPGACGFLYEAGNENALLETLLKARELDIKTEQAKVKTQFENELSFAAIAGKINETVASLFSNG